MVNFTFWGFRISSKFRIFLWGFVVMLKYWVSNWGVRVGVHQCLLAPSGKGITKNNVSVQDFSSLRLEWSWVIFLWSCDLACLWLFPCLYYSKIAQRKPEVRLWLVIFPQQCIHHQLQGGWPPVVQPQEEVRHGPRTWFSGQQRSWNHAPRCRGWHSHPHQKGRR